MGVRLSVGRPIARETMMESHASVASGIRHSGGHSSWHLVRTILLTVAVLLGVGLGAAIGYVLLTSDSSRDISGRIVIRGAASGVNAGQECEEPWFYFTLINVDSFQVHDRVGNRIGMAELSKGHASADGACVFTFTVDNVGDADQYLFAVGPFFGVQTVTREELERNKWRVQFVFGPG